MAQNSIITMNIEELREGLDTLKNIQKLTVQLRQQLNTTVLWREERKEDENLEPDSLDFFIPRNCSD